MDNLSIGEISGAGMAFERNRLEAASINLAQANIAYGSAAEAMSSANELIDNQFSKLIGLKGINNVDSAQSTAKIKTIYDPAHPKSDQQGNVYFIDVDPINEMATLVSALRAYEANVRVYNINGTMKKAAFSIGSNK